jgi:hypothetical protein
MKSLNKVLCVVAIASLGIVASEATAGRKKPQSAIKLKPGVLAMPVLSPTGKAPVAIKKKADGSDPCELITPAAIQHAIDEIDAAVAASQDNLVAHNPAEYASAGPAALSYFQQARDQMVSLQTWLHDNHLDSPFVSNLSAAYSVHWYARDAAGIIAYGEHWAGISAVYNVSVEARNAADHGTRATELLADIGRDGLRCYVQGYFPD